VALYLHSVCNVRSLDLSPKDRQPFLGIIERRHLQALPSKEECIPPISHAEFEEFPEPCGAELIGSNLGWSARLLAEQARHLDVGRGPMELLIVPRCVVVSKHVLGVAHSLTPFSRRLSTHSMVAGYTFRRCSFPLPRA
jgi:hypothetical protein